MRVRLARSLRLHRSGFGGFAEQVTHPRIPMGVPMLVFGVPWLASLVTVKRMLPVCCCSWRRLLVVTAAEQGSGRRGVPNA